MKRIVTLAALLAGIINLHAQSASEIPAGINALLSKNICNSCHKLDEKFIGPSYRELASKGNSAKEIAALIVQPNPENWPGYPPMAPMPHIDKKEVKRMADWIESLGGE